MRFSERQTRLPGRDATIATWSSHDPAYRALASRHPWDLDETAQAVVEAAFIKCPCGGSFRFNQPPRCPHCAMELPELDADPIYYLILGRHIDGEQMNLWIRGNASPIEER